MSAPPPLPGGPPPLLAVASSTIAAALIGVAVVGCLILALEVPSILIQALGRPLARRYLRRGSPVPRWLRWALQWADWAEELVSAFLSSLDWLDPPLYRAIRWIWITLRIDFWALLFSLCVDLLRALYWAAVRSLQAYLWYLVTPDTSGAPEARDTSEGADSGPPDQ